MNKHKISIFSYVMFFCLIILTDINAFSQEEYFEGVIEYSIKYDIKNPLFSSEKLKRFYGSKIITKFSRGNFRDDYYNDDGVLVRTSVLNLQKKQYYVEYSKFDTLFYTDIDTTDYTTTVKQFPDKEILKNNCWVIKSTSIPKNKTKTSESIVVKYYYSKEIKIDPKWYKEYIDGSFDIISRLAPGISIKTETINENFDIIESIVAKREQKIDPTDFELRSNQYKKKLN